MDLMCLTVAAFPKVNVIYSPASMPAHIIRFLDALSTRPSVCPNPSPGSAANQAIILLACRVNAPQPFRKTTRAVVLAKRRLSEGVSLRATRRWSAQVWTGGATPHQNAGVSPSRVQDGLAHRQMLCTGTGGSNSGPSQPSLPCIEVQKFTVADVYSALSPNQEDTGKVYLALLRSDEQILPSENDSCISYGKAHGGGFGLNANGRQRQASLKSSADYDGSCTKAICHKSEMVQPRSSM
ncbi:hypothetical protein B0T10DRAFT_463675 [Thelonectria olida]|uniref:Uncharacterized protein n=1 Tax=Thelonectria olida TaxID=1576542 RepID=A0A9P8VWV9_9HYPO|nr:hypothetical protein B0T10DRAFT_463675 [Thelonectria olida]